MSRSKHGEAQITALVKQLEACRRTEDVGREAGVGTQLYAIQVRGAGFDLSC
jgi:hypothetical protein